MVVGNPNFDPNDLKLVVVLYKDFQDHLEGLENSERKLLFLVRIVAYYF